ncbi:MAG: hypothetical protein AB8I08_13605 [Sandaracinaceae bacterium]
MPARLLALVSLLLLSGASLGASADEGNCELHTEIAVSLLEVDAATAESMADKPALDAVVQRPGKTRASSLSVARYHSVGIRLGLMHQHEGVRVVQSPRLQVVGGPARPERSPWSLEEAPEVTVDAGRTVDGRITLRIDLGAQGTVHVVVSEGESVMVSGIEMPDPAGPPQAPRLGSETPTRTRLLFVTPPVSDS